MLLLNSQWESETKAKMERFENFAQKSNVCKIGTKADAVMREIDVIKNTARLAKYLLRAWIWSPAHKSGIVTHACNPSTREVKVGNSGL